MTKATKRRRLGEKLFHAYRQELERIRRLERMRVKKERTEYNLRRAEARAGGTVSGPHGYDDMMDRAKRGEYNGPTSLRPF